MELFEHVFNKAMIYDALFFNIKSVLEFPTLNELKENKPELYDQWVFLCKTKYSMQDSQIENAEEMMMQDLFNKYAVYYPEYTKIVAITYAKVYSEEKSLKRDFKKIVGIDELKNIESFQKVLLQISTDGINSTPQYFPTLCGHNIINYDIPFFIKRLLMHRDELEYKTIPFLLKKYLQSKPWDSNIVDTINIWKFNGKDYTNLNLLSDFLGLKRNVDLLSPSELSKYYWENIGKKEKETLDFVGLQSANQTNLIIQFLNELRQF